MAKNRRLNKIIMKTDGLWKISTKIELKIIIFYVRTGIV